MPRLLPLVALCLILSALGASSAAAEDANTREFDQLSLTLHLEPDLQRGLVVGRSALEFEALVEGFRTLRLHCVDTRVLAVIDADARPLAWSVKDGILSIELAEPLPKGRASRIVVSYRSTPKRGLYFHRPTRRHPKTPLFMYSQGQSNDNRRWIPCYDLPDDRFRFELHVTVPAELETVSNGRLVEQKDGEDGRRTDHWLFEDETPSYLISLVVADLETVRDEWEETTLEYTAVPGHTEELKTALGETPAMMAFFSEELAAPYPWDRYAQTFVWDFIYGGMENVTATTLNMRALHLPSARPNYSSEGLVAHELAHMWFGDLITCRTWDDIWLNEGFATYLTDLYFGHAYGHDEFQLRRRNQNRSYMDGTPHPENLGLKRHPRGDRPLELFGGKQYSRGAAILHMLRLELGDDVYREAIRLYVKRHRGGTATSEDLRHAVEEVAGRDLHWFWNQWVYGAGYPVLDVSWNPESGRVEVRQKQGRKNAQGLFRLTLPVRVGAAGEVHPLRIWRDRHVFMLPLPEGDGARYLRAGVGGDLLARVHVSQGRQAWMDMLASDPDVTGRLDAIEQLEPYGRAVALDRALARDTSWAVRQRAAESLVRLDHNPAAIKALLTGGADSDPRVRTTIFEALGGLHRDLVTEVLLLVCREETHDYPRAAAARSLGRVKAQGAFDVLVELLRVDSHGDVVRAGALDGLRALGDVRGAARAREYCDYAWGDGGTQKLRKTALDCVTALAPDTPETRALLVSLLEDPHHSMRSWAAQACGAYAVRSARRRLEQLAKNDWNGGVRHAAAQALEQLKK